MTYNIYNKSAQELERDSYQVINGSPFKNTSAVKYADIRYDSDDSQPDYIGMAASSLATSDTGWEIYKFTYSSGNITRIQYIKGVWDSRATLF